MSANWKRIEREIARILGGRRIPVSGRARGDVADIEHEWLAIECKHRRTLPAWLLSALDQAEAAARPDQLAIVVLHGRGQRYKDSLVLCRLGDFRTWFVGDADELNDGA